MGDKRHSTMKCPRRIRVVSLELDDKRLSDNDNDFYIYEYSGQCSCVNHFELEVCEERKHKLKEIDY